MIDLFCYTDYTAFLRDYYQERRKKYPFFSYRYFGRKAGIDAGNLVKILQGKRHLSAAGVKRFIEYAKFSNREAKYFETLVQFKKAKREQDNKVLFEKLMAIQRIDPCRLEPMQYEFYREW
ncbi:MAG: TIGR02147 family protein, partial [Chitinispirillaceae bacterium]|nr:TIGR02147 family protein [Chitinispirillaceae bacterium]